MIFYRCFGVFLFLILGIFQGKASDHLEEKHNGKPKKFWDSLSLVEKMPAQTDDEKSFIQFSHGVLTENLFSDYERAPFADCVLTSLMRRECCTKAISFITSHDARNDPSIRLFLNFLIENQSYWDEKGRVSMGKICQILNKKDPRTANIINEINRILHQCPPPILVGKKRSFTPSLSDQILQAHFEAGYYHLNNDPYQETAWAATRDKLFLDWVPQSQERQDLLRYLNLTPGTSLFGSFYTPPPNPIYCQDLEKTLQETKGDPHDICPNPQHGDSNGDSDYDRFDVGPCDADPIHTPDVQY